jgi:hypothetical protein
MGIRFRSQSSEGRGSGVEGIRLNAETQKAQSFAERTFNLCSTCGGWPVGLLKPAATNQ